MRSGISKSRARRSHLQLPKALQGKWLDTVASRSTETDLQPKASLPVASDTFREMNADEAGYVVVKQPCQPAVAASGSVPSSKSLSSANDKVPCSGGRKRKASSSSQRPPPRELSRLRSKAQEY
ncbi:hypothetical protein F4779DRAFT_614539 [Xylariaceae sp. FL0662B]|nr:hypothetical protein F4779DRAFT_614539 [Xylariaceae sp. FL0662B]